MLTRILNFIKPKSAVEWTVALTFSFAVGLTSYWAIVDRKPLASSISEIVTPTVYAGETFSINYELTWNTSCTVRGYRFVIDSAKQQYTIAPDDRYVTPHDDPHFTINIPIPKSAEPGPAIYKATILYSCNPWQRLFPIERQIEDKQFVILAPKDESQMVEKITCGGVKPVLVASYCRGIGLPKKEETADVEKAP